jgi:hypothetical protein
MMYPADTLCGNREVARVCALCTHAREWNAWLGSRHTSGRQLGDAARRWAVSTGESAAALVVLAAIGVERSQ